MLSGLATLLMFAAHSSHQQYTLCLFCFVILSDPSQDMIPGQYAQVGAGEPQAPATGAGQLQRPQNPLGRETISPTSLSRTKANKRIERYRSSSSGSSVFRSKASDLIPDSPSLIFSSTLPSP